MISEKSIKQAIITAIHAIPTGSASSYGAVARAAGYPGRARLVARVLSESEDAGLPWHRVLRSSGQIAFPVGSPMFLEQERRLRAEGVAVVAGRVKMPKRGFDLDALMWAPE